MNVSILFGFTILKGIMKLTQLNNNKGCFVMKLFHTADWHLGKLVQGVYMTEDQEYILTEFIKEVEIEQPDAIIIAGDLYDRAVPPPEAIELLNRVLDKIVLELNIPILAIAGNHDSPSRLHFGSRLMRERGFHLIGQLDKQFEPIVLEDEFGSVHFHLVPYCDPSVVRHIFQDDTVKTHNDATKLIVEKIHSQMVKNARHIYVGHAFVTPYGEEEANTSESEKPLSIGGAEYVDANHFDKFHYTALGHLHQSHHVLLENIRYAGSPLKYSISEEHHSKGFNIVNIDGNGKVEVEKRVLKPKRDMRTVEATIDDILTYPISEDYVYVRLLDEHVVLSPMEKVRSVFPNAMHVERKNDPFLQRFSNNESKKSIKELSDLALFKAFYEEVKGETVTEEMETIFK